MTFLATLVISATKFTLVGSFSDLSSWRIPPVVEALCIPTARRRQHLLSRHVNGSAVCPRGPVGSVASIEPSSQLTAATEVAALSKERAWTAQAEAQGEAFYPLAIEAGGALNARFYEFLQLLAVAFSPSPAE